MDPEHPAEFVVVENTPEMHNLIVCTLCSCYPRAILGRPPDWYKSFEYRSRAVREPRAVMREFGFEPPEGVEVVVHDSTADVRYMVLPMRPPARGHERRRTRPVSSRATPWSGSTYRVYSISARSG